MPNACLVEFHLGGDGSALEQVQFNRGESGGGDRGPKMAREGSEGGKRTGATDSVDPMNE